MRLVVVAVAMIVIVLWELVGVIVIVVMTVLVLVRMIRDVGMLMGFGLMTVLMSMVVLVTVGLP